MESARALLGRRHLLRFLCLMLSASPQVATGAALSSYGDVERVLFAGCVEVFVGPVCMVDKSSALRFWAPADDPDDLLVDIDGVDRVPELSRIRDGFLFQVAPSPTTRRITVRSRGSHVFVELNLIHIDEDKDLDLVALADVRRREPGGLDDARAMVERSMLSSSPLVRARALGIAARLAMKSGRLDEAIEMFDHSIESFRAIGCVTGQLRDLFALAYLQTYLKRDFAGAEDSLERARGVDPDAPEWLVSLPYYEGLLAFLTGDILGALTQFERCAHDAERLQLAVKLRYATIGRIDVLSRIGRCDEALEILATVAEAVDESDIQRRAEIEQARGWHRLVCTPSLSADGEDAREIIGHFERAIALFQKMQTPLWEAAVLGSLARVKLEIGAVEDAQAALDRAESLAPVVESRLRAERMNLRAQVLAAAGKTAEALEALDTIRMFAAKNQLPFESWRALAARAYLAEDMGRLEDAAQIYRSGDEELHRLFLMVPLGLGRDAFVSSHLEFSRRHVALLLKLDRPKDAMNVAIESRARSFRLLDVARRVRALSPHDRRAWDSTVAQLNGARQALEPLLEKKEALQSQRATAPTSRLAAIDRQLARNKSELVTARKTLLGQLNAGLRMLDEQGPQEPWSTVQQPGELLLAFHPVPTGWAAFAATDDGVVTAASIDTTDVAPKDLAAHFMEPFKEAMQRASRVGIVVTGAIERLPLHAVAFGDGPPLAQNKDVRFVLPIGASRPAARTKRALVVAVDQVEAQLPRALREGARVAEALQKRGWDVVHLHGAEATRAAVLRHLSDPSIDTFHYAGHATNVSQSPDGWESRLLLADGPLMAAEILALRHVPGRVILSACSGAKSSGYNHGGLGLAQAFLLAGSGWVLASDKDVDDDVAERVMTKLYAKADPFGGGRSLFEDFDASDGWTDYRIIARR